MTIKFKYNGGNNMDLIFCNGNKLYNKEKLRGQRRCGKFIEEACDINLNDHQKQILHDFIDSKKTDFNIFGDDFKINIIPKNVEEDCVLIIKDYNENQEKESEILINFSKDELIQFISLLNVIYSKM